MSKIFLRTSRSTEPLGDVCGKPHVPFDESVANRSRTRRRKLDEQFEIVESVETALGGVLRHRRDAQSSRGGVRSGDEEGIPQRDRLVPTIEPHAISPSNALADWSSHTARVWCSALQGMSET
ncbi:MAG TPA: hypothetical protein VHP57_09645 [Acidimicrobiia bacterium]|nr:hypothetical protein [Acidimicrobiia bacterium]